MWLKICGVNSPDAVASALSAGVDAIGLVFSPSVRRLEPAQAARLAAPARGRLTLVAVTRHPSQALVDAIIAQFKPDALQTDLADFDGLQLPQSLARLPVLRAVVAPGVAAPSRLLFEGARSGSGQPADWDAADTLARTSELILAGGLTAANVAMAIERVRPHGVDVSSGVESAPGCKSAQLIDEFVQAARAGFRARQPD
ncbi:MAG: phosphoribosylanthranilate isomerase [Steroidobacteraceae bacterium]